ncbi:MAG TPA: mandelate racemase/muconate lactonizing enzyme family protein [Bryobacteraceae bacterium]|nr:mandelate racemase/muconate lactonizing enzyme family protein [Bryobacteraceae bacterium]
MTVTQVQSFLLSFPFPEPIRLSFYGGERTILNRDAMLVRVDSSSGITGYAPGPGSARAHDAIRNVIAPFLEGAALADPDALRVKFETGPGSGDPELMKAYCAVEIALWDVFAKSYGAPLSEVLGGRERERIRLYGSAGMYQSPEKYAEEAAAIADLGFRAYKMRPALGPAEDVRTVRLMREAVGPGVDLMIDAHTWWRMGDRSYAPETVDRVAEEMSEFDPLWLEEPLPPSDHAAYAALRAKELIPLASGEHEPDEEGFLDLIDSDAVDYAQMDVCCQGGFAMARRLFGVLARRGLRFAFHSWGTDLEVLAAAHLGICWPDSVVEWLEYPCYSGDGKPGMYPFPLAHEILNQPLQIEKGELIVPREPGLGIEINESVIEKYPWIPGPWSFFRIDSPPQTLAVVGDHSIPWEERAIGQRPSGN